MPREITVYEEDDPSHMFGYKDHVGRTTIFEIRKCGIGYSLTIDGEKPDFISQNGVQYALEEVKETTF